MEKIRMKDLSFGVWLGVTMGILNFVLLCLFIVIIIIGFVGG